MSTDFYAYGAATFALSGSLPAQMGPVCYNSFGAWSMRNGRGGEMKWLTKGILIFTVVVAIGLAGLTVRIVGFALEIKPFVDQADRGREHLFYETDYGELLAGCRELSRRVAEGSLEPKQYQAFFFNSDPDPNALTFAQVILDLKPSFVRVDRDGVVDVELLPGPEYFGVFAYAENDEGWGDVRLADHLWYYDSDYATVPKYRTRIDRMIEESRKHSAAQNAAQAEPR